MLLRPLVRSSTITPLFSSRQQSHRLGLARMASSSSSSSSSSDADTIILGAGWAGLMTALRLSQASRKVLVLEGRERLGGRSFTHTYSPQTKGSGDRTVPPNGGKEASSAQQQWWKDPNITAVDFGSSWIHGYNEGNPVKELCKELDIPVTIPSRADLAEAGVIGKPAIVGPLGILSDELTKKLEANLGKAMQAAQDLAKTSAVPPPANASLGSFLLNVNNSPLFEGLKSQEEKDYAADYARQLHVPLGTTLEQAALRWTGFEQNYAGTDAAPEGGFTRIIDAVAGEVEKNGGKIMLNEKVIAVELEQGSKVRVTTQSGQSFIAPTTTCTIPLAVLKQTQANLFQRPPLTERKQTVIDKVNVGDLNKVMLVYEEAWWPKGITTFTVLPDESVAADTSSSSSQESQALLDLFSKTTLIVSVDQTKPSLLIMIGADAAREIENYKRLIVVEALHQYLTNRLEVSSSSSDEQIASPSHNFMTRWSGHAFTGGATTTPMIVPSSSEDVAATPLDLLELARPEWPGGILGFAGEHTEINHRGSVAGAVVSAEREARRVEGLLSKL